MHLISQKAHDPLPALRCQRTVPYFFELRNDGCSYRWGQVAFVQTPQRFPVSLLNCNLSGTQPTQHHPFLGPG